MFSQCKRLKNLDLYFFNTKNVIDMRGMFYYCTSLKELNILNFVTNNVINMDDMFIGCDKYLKIICNNDNIVNEALKNK